MGGLLIMGAGEPNSPDGFLTIAPELTARTTSGGRTDLVRCARGAVAGSRGGGVVRHADGERRGGDSVEVRQPERPSGCMRLAAGRAACVHALVNLGARRTGVLPARVAP